MLTNITKREAAKQQLLTAIDLLLSDKSLISVYSLATNAWEVIDELCKHAGIESFSEEVRENIPNERKLKQHYINANGRNFFKHADKDPDAVFDKLDYEQCDSVILLAVKDYIQLFCQSPIEFQVFEIWYLAIYPEKVNEAARESLANFSDSHFPGASSKSRQEQLELARAAISNALREESVVKDPRTEA